MSSCGYDLEIKNREESKVLIVLLIINAFMFFAEIILGFLSQSTALIADSLDMLADAAIYGIALYAVGKSPLVKIKAAYMSGIFQVILGSLVLVDIIRRFFLGSEPQSYLMVSVGMAALLANLVCLKLISKHRKGEVHMRASWIFSKNDVIANLGIIIGGLLVYILGSRYPDLVIGFTISVVVIRGGILIIKDAANEKILAQ